MTADLHCHTKLSDGSMGIDELIVLAKKKGIETLAITDCDCLAGTVRGKVIGERHGINVIPGVEISAFDSKTQTDLHIICYQPDSPDRLEGLCRRNSLSRKKASQFMILKVAQRYPITPDLVLKCAAGSTNVYPQHIMHALMECAVTTELYGDIYHELFSPESSTNVIVHPQFPEPSEVIEQIRAAGGIAVLARPAKAKCMHLIDELVEAGLHGIEVWHPDHSPEEVLELIKISKEKKLLMTGGSDFKGMYSQKAVSLGEVEIPQQQLSAFLGFKAKLRRRQKKAENT